MDSRQHVLTRKQGGVKVSRDEWAEGREIGAHVGHGLHLQPQELAALVKRQLGMGDVVAAVGVREEGFRTLGGPFDGPPNLLRRPGHHRLFRIVRNLRTEPAAHVGRDDAQLVLGDLEHEGAHQEPRHVRVLAGAVERVAVACRVVLAER